MKHRQPLSAAEQQLLEHYRTHQADQPSAALDARILAAAAAQTRRQAERPSLLARLYAWLCAGAARRRWSLALGSVAVLGLGLSLSLRTLEQAPERYDSPLPAAPALQRHAAPAPQKKRMAESSRPSEPRIDVMADSAAVPMEEALESSGGPVSAAPAKVEQAPLPQALRAALTQIAVLRARGLQDQAAERLAALQQRYPQLNLEELLGHLPASDEGQP